MPALREVQRAFAASVLRREPVAPTLRPRPADGRLERRLGVYRVNARENFAAALEAAFPLLRRQLGAEGFASLAWSYQQRCPSTSGNLFETGRRLPAFLDGILEGTPDDYLRDVARLEWAVQESMVAADGDRRFDPRPLAAIPPAEHARLRFSIDESTRAVATRHAVFGLWRDLQEGGADEPLAVPAATPERILVRRAPSGIELARLDDAGFACLECLLRGATLGEMAEAALAVSGSADAGAILLQWANDGVITGLADERDRS
jgi:hypothetical protein